MSAGTDEKAAEITDQAAGGAAHAIDKVIGRETLHGEGAEPNGPAAPVSNLNVLRVAIFMSADSMLADLRAIRSATTLEEAQAIVNLMIDRVAALSEAAEIAAE